MSTFLPQDILDDLASSKRAKLSRSARHRVKFNGEIYPLNRFWTDGFALDAEYAPNMRGLVDIFDGQEHITRCLVVASEESEGEVSYEYKVMTQASTEAPLDFVRPSEAPVALLEQPIEDPKRLL